MTNDLIPDTAVMYYLPGAPFSVEQVDAAVATVRLAAGWHIAPQRTETILLEVNWPTRWLALPTRKLVDVVEVRDADTGEVIDPAHYRTSRDLATLRFRTGGFEAVEVDLTHGFAECPPELLPVIAGAVTQQGRDQTIRQVQVDDFSQSFVTNAGGVGGPLSNAAILDAYSLHSAVPVIA